MSIVSTKVMGLFALSVFSLATGCSGGGGASNISTDVGTGTFSLGITDGPVDDAVNVVVEFTGVSIKPVDGEVIEFNFTEAKQIDLLQLQGSASDSLLTNETVVAGDYEWIRLHVTAEQNGVMDSYLEMKDGTQIELRIPSGAETGLKLVNGFTIAAGGTASFTIDFDLRKSVIKPAGMPSAMLRPALRLVNNLTVGSIIGTIDENLVMSSCIDASIDDGSVYAYSGAGVTPTDIQGTTSDPLVTALVHLSEEGYTYELGFLPEGEYTLAYTCGASNDDPLTADNVEFMGSTTVTVLADMASSHDFVADIGDTVTPEESDLGE